MSTYLRETLFRSDRLEVLCCSWSMGSVSKPHDHGLSTCAVVVQEGLFENTLLGATPETTLFEAGSVIVTPARIAHSLQCVSEKGKTIHFYSPPLRAEPEQGVRNFRPLPIAEIRDASVRIQQSGMDFSELEDAFRVIESRSVTTASPYFMNQLFSGYHPEAVLAEQFLSTHKTTLATYEASPALTAIEQEVTSQLGTLVGWKRSEGISVPGGSSANFMALHLARHFRNASTKDDGNGAGEYAIFVSDQAHYSLKKAAVVLGFGVKSIVPVQTDAAGRMITSDLEKQFAAAKERGAKPLAVCATSGTTVLGAFDPIAEIAKVCAENKAWLHVDAAWGGPILFSPAHRNLMAGIELADSFTFDGHKFFGASLTSSFLVNRHSGLLRAANDVSGTEYLFHDDDGIDLGRMSWQCGKKSDALSFWAIWKRRGTDGLRQLVETHYRTRDEVLEYVRTQPRLRLAHQPEFLNLCVYVDPPPGAAPDPQYSRKIREALIRDNIAMVNYSVDREGGSFLRLIFAHPDLQSKHCIGILEAALSTTFS